MMRVKSSVSVLLCTVAHVLFDCRQQHRLLWREHAVASYVLVASDANFEQGPWRTLTWV